MAEVILDVQNLKTHFRTHQGIVKAVDGVSFKVHRGETYALVGESGSGKSVTCMTVMGLIGKKKDEVVTGDIYFKGTNLTKLSLEDRRRLRGKHMAIIFQDPMTSLNPVYTVGTQIAEMPIIHEGSDKKSAWQVAVEMLRKVGIPSPEDRARDYPHQFSGGMRQRGVIGMSLSLDPDLLIADEPTTALDVTIQAQILDLMKDLKDQTDAAIVMITHDLGVVAQIADHVGVMYAGTIVETADVRTLYKDPRHPYTRGLLNSIPKPGSKDRLEIIKGQPPDLHNVPEGCSFSPRCPHAHDRCREAPPVVEVAPGHQVACWLMKEDQDHA